ncbi:MAG: 50S ribosomal protein L10, partial [Fimbriiglobus sp.]
MSKKVKAYELEALRKSLGGIKDFVLIEPLKVNAATDFEFRKNLRQRKVKVQLVKNTLARKILGETGVTLDGQWGGPTLLCYGGTNAKDLGNAVDEQLKA